MLQNMSCCIQSPPEDKQRATGDTQDMQTRRVVHKIQQEAPLLPPASYHSFPLSLLSGSGVGVGEASGGKEGPEIRCVFMRSGQCQ